MKNKKIIDICNKKLILLNYSKNTVKIYNFYIKKFIESVGNKQASHLNSKDFQGYIDNYKFTSVSQQNQILNAIRFLYKYGLSKKYAKVSFDRPRPEKKLPRVIEKEFLLKRLSLITNIKHKAILTLAYSTGIRVSELCNLKISDVDSKRMIIHIKNAKGRKERIVPLSTSVLLLLRVYFKIYKPIEYLFNGQTRQKYSHSSCNKIVKKYIGNNYHFHLLRHSNATAMLEAGTDLRYIQKHLGHSSSKTTEIYTHVSTAQLQKLITPI